MNHDSRILITNHDHESPIAMLPASYQLPAAAILLLGGIVSCFFGYRLFRTVLAIFGFILGGLLASSVFGVSNTDADARRVGRSAASSARSS